MATQNQIKKTIEKGITWIKSQQYSDGSYGKWTLASTSFAVMVLLSSNATNSDPAVTKAISYILNTDPPDSTYFRSLTIMALTAYGKKTPPILKRVQSDTKWLMEAQGSNQNDRLSFGGWDHFYHPEISVGLNTQYALLALYKASLWGVTIPQEIWSRAIIWYQGNHDTHNDGSYVYHLGDTSQFNNKEVLYGMTAGAFVGLKTINLASQNPDVTSQANDLLEKAFGWLEMNNHVKLKQDVSDKGHYNYLFSLQTGCTLEPCAAFLKDYNWYDDIANYLIIKQKPNGKWVSDSDQESREIIYTSLALLTLIDRYNAEKKSQNITKKVSKATNKSFFKSPVILFVVICSILCTVAVSAFMSDKSEEKMPLMTVYECSQNSLACGVGNIAPMTTEIYGKVSGAIKNISAKPGWTVSTGDVIIKIDPSELEFELSQVADEIKKCQLKIKNLSHMSEFDVKADMEGIIKKVHVHIGAEVEANTSIATLLSHEILDITLENLAYEHQFLNQELPVDLYLPDGNKITGVLCSSVKVDKNNTESTNLQVKILHKELENKVNEEMIEPEIELEDKSPKARIVIHTSSNTLSSTCQVANAELHVFAKHKGKFTKMSVKEGNHVSKGQSLARIRINESFMNLQTEQIELNKLLNLQNHLKELLKDYKIISPVTGKISAFFVRKGDIVQPDMVLALIEKSECYQITLPITEKESATIQPGFPACVTILEVDDKQLKGVVDRIIKGVPDEKGRFLKAIVVINKEPNIEPGMPAQVKIFPKL